MARQVIPVQYVCIDTVSGVLQVYGLGQAFYQRSIVF